MSETTGVTAEIYVEHPDLALTKTVAHDAAAVVRPVSGAGTDPRTDTHLFTVRTSDFDCFEAGLARDDTIASFEQVVYTPEEAVYSFEYTDGAKLVSPVISTINGVVLEMTNDGTAWTLTVWCPERRQLARLWEYASANEIHIELRNITTYRSPVETETGLTDSQREALSVALAAGYFEEPRAASLTEVAEQLNISQPAAGGRIRRGMKRLATSALEQTE